MPGSGRCWCARRAGARTSSAAPSSRRSATSRRGTPTMRWPRSPSSTVRCRNDTAIALGKIGDQRALNAAGQPSAHGARGVAAVCGRGHLSAGRELRDRTRSFSSTRLKFASSTTGFQESAARPRRAWPRSRLPAGREAAEALFDRRDSVASDPTRAPVSLALATIALRRHAVDDDDPSGAPEARCGDRAHGRGVRHARGGSTRRNGSLRSFATPTGTRRRIRRRAS